MANDKRYVKWQVDGGWAFGVAGKAKEGKISVNVPPNQLTSVAEDNLIDIDQAEYTELVTELITSLGKINGVNFMSQIDDLTNQLKAAQDESAEAAKTRDELKARLEKMEEEAKKYKEEMDAVRQEMKSLEDEKASVAQELETIRLERLAESRYAQIKEHNAVEVIFDKASADEAREQLAQMTEAVFNQMLAVAQRVGKMTDQTLSSQPKSTDQTRSSQPKSSDADVKVDVETAETDLDSATNVTDETKDADIAAASVGTADEPTWDERMNVAMASLIESRPNHRKRQKANSQDTK